jgi:hypothetical protein
MKTTHKRRWMGSHTRMRLAALGAAAGAVAAGGVASTPAAAKTCTAVAPCSDLQMEYWSIWDGSSASLPEFDARGASVASVWTNASLPSHAAGDWMRTFLYVGINSQHGVRPWGAGPNSSGTPSGPGSWAEIGGVLGGPLGDSGHSTTTAVTPYKREQPIGASPVEVLYSAGSFGGGSIQLHSPTSSCFDVYINGSLITCLSGMMDSTHYLVDQIELGITAHSTTNYKSSAIMQGQYMSGPDFPAYPFGTWHPLVPSVTPPVSGSIPQLFNVAGGSPGGCAAWTSGAHDAIKVGTESAALANTSGGCS